MNPQDTITTPHPGSIPSSPALVSVPSHRANQIQQTKSSAKSLTTSVLPTTQPNQSAVEARTTPAHVSGVRIRTEHAVNGQKNITVRFRHPAGDAYFSGANVYLQRAGQQPSLVASGAKSPLTFTAPVHQATHTVFVTSVSNWGETAIKGSPARHVRLV